MRQLHLTSATFIIFMSVLTVQSSSAAESFFPEIIDLHATYDGVVKIFGDNTRDKTGISITTGNVNGDGYDDLIIGAMWADPFERSNAGMTYIIFGSAGVFSFDEIDFSGSPLNVLRICGGNEGDCLGRSVSSGDVNGDGYDDIIMGAYDQYSDAESYTGKTYIMFGSDDLTADYTIDLAYPPVDVLTIVSNETGDHFGFSTAAGDINGDGYDDIIIGAMAADPVERIKTGITYLELERIDAGMTYILEGSPDISVNQIINVSELPSGVIKVMGEDAGDNMGVFTAAGDVNGDGCDDIVIGAWFADRKYDENILENVGKTYLVAGSTDIFSRGDIDLKNPTCGAVAIIGENSYDLSGAYVAVGDINGDGYEDILTESHGFDLENRNEPGAVYIVKGYPDITEIGIIDLCDPPHFVTRIIGNAPEDHLSRGLIGDINGNGVSDLIIAATDADPSDKSKAGETYMLCDSPLTEKEVIDLHDPPAGMIKILGDDVDGHLGFSLSTGDLNGDDYNDLIIGAHDSSPFGKYQAGKVYILSGAGVYEEFEGPSHFVYDINTGNNATILILSDTPPNLFGKIISSGDVIGVFTPGGLCSGAGTWNGKNLAITVWGDDPQTEGINGFLSGEKYHFKIWDESEQKEYTVTAIYQEGEGVYAVDGITIIQSLETQLIDFTIELPAGWNLISSPIIPLDPLMESILADIEDNLVLAKNGKGQVYWPRYGINQIGEWSITDGYQVYMSDDDNLTISGFDVLPAEVTYILGRNWGLISYIGEEGIRPSEAFYSIIDNIIVMKDNAGNVFWPEYDIDQIEALYHGNGYWIYLSSPVRFSYQGSVYKRLLRIKTEDTSQTYFNPVNNTGNNATLLIRSEITPTIEGRLLVPGDEIGIFSPDNRCVGAGTWNGDNLAITVWGDNTHTDEIDGIQSGEKYLYRLWDSQSHNEYNARATYTSDKIVFAVNDIVVLESLAGEDIVTIENEQIPAQFSLSQNYPNPFNPVTTITFSLPYTCHVTLTIYNTVGEKLQTLADTFYPAGEYTVDWDAGECSSGIYFYRIEAGTFIQTRKLLLVK